MPDSTDWIRKELEKSGGFTTTKPNPDGETAWQTEAQELLEESSVGKKMGIIFLGILSTATASWLADLILDALRGQ